MRIAYLYDFYGEILSEKQQLVFEMYYNDDCSLGEIAQQIGISRQGVRDSVKRSEAALSEMEDKLGLAGRFEDMLADIERIKSDALMIGRSVSGVAVTENIRQRAEDIVRTADELKNRF